jgi:LytS/YehU family sensor histidine kinase
MFGIEMLFLFGLVPPEARLNRWGADLRIALLISLAIGISQVAYAHFRSRLAQTELQLKIEELARLQAEKLASEARFASLESRLQPHFLFNTLNSISSLIGSNPQRAEQLLGRFSAVLRSSLDAPAEDLVALQAEMKLVADYLEIQQARYAHRLRYALHVPEALLQHRVPPFSVQTLVENSVKFAVAPSPSGSTIEVSAVLDGERLRIEVVDDGPGFTAAQIQPHHGIDNLRERLRALFGEAAQLAIGRSPAQRTQVAIELPVTGKAPS